MDLEKVREHINSIDDKLTELYVERMNLCKEVGVIKA
jgi:chorismate mutase